MLTLARCAILKNLSWLKLKCSAKIEKFCQFQRALAEDELIHVARAHSEKLAEFPLTHTEFRHPISQERAEPLVFVSLQLSSPPFARFRH